MNAEHYQMNPEQHRHSHMNHTVRQNQNATGAGLLHISGGMRNR
jgi:hypothetical protein